MATGTLLACLVNRNGVYAHLKFEGLATGGAYDFGTLPASAKGTLAVTSEGYDATGTLGTVARDVLLDTPVLLPYPDGNTAPDTETWYVVHGPVTLNGRRGFEDGETVTQAGSGATALVCTDCPCAPLIIHTVTGTANASGVWTGGTSGATLTPSAAPATYSYGAKREGTDGSDLWITVALHSKVHDDDRNGGAGTSGTDPVLTVAAGLYGASLAGSVTATNLSALDYPKVIARWAIAPKQRFTGSLDLEVQAWHGHGIACVTWTATDGTNAPTLPSATEMTLSSDADQLPVYAATLTASDFAVRSTVTCNFTACPLVGDADSVTTTVGGTTQPSTTLGPLTLLADPDNSYGVTVAYVDPVSGNDSTCVAADIAADSTAAASPAATMKGALVKISAYNNTHHARNTCDAGIVYLMTGSHSTGDGSVAGTTTAATAWVTVTRAPGLADGDAVVDGRMSSYNLGPALLRVDDLDLTTVAADSYLFQGSGTASLWMSRNRLAAGGTSTNPVANGFGTAYFTDNAATDVYVPYHMASGTPVLHRNNTATGVNFGTQGGLCIVGNDMDQRTGTTNTLYQPTAAQDNVIIAYNRGTVTYAGLSAPTTVSTGFACVFNELEKTGADSGVIAAIYADGNTQAANHVIFDHNTMCGQRVNFVYRDVLAGGRKTNVFARYNSLSWLPTKHDNFTGTQGNDGRRAAGAEDSEYGADQWGNVSERGYAGDPLGADSFPPNYAGVNSVRAQQAAYVADASQTGTNGGGGDYGLTADSPGRNRVPAGWRVARYDLARNEIDDNGGGSAGTRQYAADVTPDSPTVAPSATPNPVTGTTTTLADNTTGGTAPYAYAWTLPGASLDDATAENPVATFTAAGTYTASLTVTDANTATGSGSVVIAVSQTLTSIAVTPSSVSLPSANTQQFTASGVDQFGAAMAVTPVWSKTGGPTIDPDTGEATGANVTVQAVASGVTGTATITGGAIKVAVDFGGGFQ